MISESIIKYITKVNDISSKEIQSMKVL
jgi:hypothetical protein